MQIERLQEKYFKVDILWVILGILQSNQLVVFETFINES